MARDGLPLLLEAEPGDLAISSLAQGPSKQALYEATALRIRTPADSLKSDCGAEAAAAKMLILKQRLSFRNWLSMTHA